MLACAADVSGKWAGKTRMSISGRIEEDTMFLTLKQEGARVTGTAGPTQEQQAAIRNGKIEEDRVTFELPVPNGIFVFDVRLAGDRLKGTLIANAQGQEFHATIEAARSK
ncbi:MAG: hypothetical protein JST11_03770 [Acidobacteria bacterium]|nr:hypothetical protein [Acidobacteriota bacterium]